MFVGTHLLENYSGILVFHFTTLWYTLVRSRVPLFKLGLSLHGFLDRNSHQFKTIRHREAGKVSQDVGDVGAEETEAAHHATGMLVVAREAARTHQGIQVRVAEGTAHHTLPAHQEN